MQAQDKEIWQSFFKNTESVFEYILNDENWFVDREIKNMAYGVWHGELKSNFQALEREILSPSIKENKNKNEKLKGVGLTENQLKFKMSVFNHWFQAGVAWISKALAAINSILGSLVKGFHLAESIKEFKDFLEIAKK